ncbi:hypothetical protein ACFPMF_12505 [Larkinella bovis]|uniref:Uncharacterized protein n=1 Tax=Larkinella bovis TaxID=683041 RepID=A0ABW0IFJ6_9BACT
MIRSLSAFFYRIASWKTLLLGIALYLPIPIFILGPLEKQLNAFAGSEIGPIDLLLFQFDPARIQQMVAAYGPEGRAVYTQGTLIDDTIYPIVYTFLFCTILSLLFRKRGTRSGPLVNVFPLAVFALDLLENACIVTLLQSYPNPLPTVAGLCSVLTNLKWASLVMTALLAGYGVIRLVFRKPVAGSLAG